MSGSIHMPRQVPRYRVFEVLGPFGPEGDCTELNALMREGWRIFGVLRPSIVLLERWEDVP